MINFTRASAATYINKQGVLSVAQANEPRFEEKGILIEGTSTNRFRRKTVENWRCTISEVNSMEDKITIKETSSTLGSIPMYLARDTFGGKTVTTSVYIRKTDVSMDIFLNSTSCWVNVDGQGKLKSVSPSSTSYKVEDFGGFFRVSMTCIVSAWVGVGLRGGVVGDSINIFGFQVEELPFASSYIPTSGNAATRAADNLYVTDFSLSGGMSFFAEWHPTAYNEGNNSNRLFDVSVKNNSDLIHISLDRVGNVSGRFSDGDTIQSTYGYPYGKVVLVGDIGTPTMLYVDSTLYQSESKVTKDVGMYNQSKIYLGANENGQGHTFGHIKNVKVWNTALTPEQVSTL